MLERVKEQEEFLLISPFLIQHLCYNSWKVSQSSRVNFGRYQGLWEKEKAEKLSSMMASDSQWFSWNFGSYPMYALSSIFLFDLSYITWEYGKKSIIQSRKGWKQDIDATEKVHTGLFKLQVYLQHLKHFMSLNVFLCSMEPVLVIHCNSAKTKQKDAAWMLISLPAPEGGYLRHNQLLNVKAASKLDRFHMAF